MSGLATGSRDKGIPMLIEYLLGAAVALFILA